MYKRQQLFYKLFQITLLNQQGRRTNAPNDVGRQATAISQRLSHLRILKLQMCIRDRDSCCCVDELNMFHSCSIKELEELSLIHICALHPQYASNLAYSVYHYSQQLPA